MPTTAPTTDNGRTIVGMYESFARGDVPAVMAKLHPDVEWIETEADEVRINGSFRGPQEVLENVFAAVPKDFQSFELRPELFIEAGDDVVVTGRCVATTLDGSVLDAPYAHVFSFRDGLVARNDNFHDSGVWMQVLETTGA
jgi:ketosteroid isomerase-like protein